MFANLSHFELGLSIDRPSNSKNGFTTGLFFEEFVTFLESFVTIHGHLLLLGDFNFYVDKCSDTDAYKLKDILNLFALHQHVHYLIITRETDAGTAHSFWIDEITMSDHFPVHFEVLSHKPQPTVSCITFRKITNINIQDFQHDIISSSAGCEAVELMLMNWWIIIMTHFRNYVINILR